MSRVAYWTGRRTFAPAHDDARTSLHAYVARRRESGDIVDIEKDAYTTSIYTRAVIVVNGTRRRMWRTGGAWRYA